MATVESLVLDAYYIAGIKSRNANQSINTTEKTTGFNILNEIIDRLKLSNSFSSFLFTLTLNNVTGTIYIGKNLTPDSEITIVDNDPFKLIFSASYTSSVTNGLFYPLLIKSLADSSQSYFSNEEGNPSYLYYDNLLQGQNIYTEIKLYPIPNQSSILNLYGIKMMQEFSDDQSSILPTFFSYLKYLVAKELAMQYSTSEIFNKRGGEQRVEEYRQILENNAPNYSNTNDLSFLLSNANYTDFHGNNNQ